MKMEELVKLLIEKGKIISTMESCTGGGIINAITNIPDASKVINFSAVTYSNEFKEKMGVDVALITKYSVYSMEVAKNMAKIISNFTDSDYGVGVTGKLKKKDDNNPFGDDDIVYLSIYDRNKDAYSNVKIKLTKDTRWENKEEIINIFVNKMMNLLCENE